VRGPAVIVALAGRRIDAPDSSPPRFPLPNVTLVERRLDELFARVGATALVGSAACGADLLASLVAGRRGLRRRVVLPFDRDRFRATSVSDRPGDWGPLYDRVLAELEATGDVVILNGYRERDDAYLAVNRAILDEAAALGRAASVEVVAVLVWEGAPRGDDDVTAAFGAEARRRGYRVEQVTTR